VPKPTLSELETRSLLLTMDRLDRWQIRPDRLVLHDYQ
jgi:hypothetical protein